MTIAFLRARVFDGISATLLDNASVVVDGVSIVSVSTDGAPRPAGAEVVDLNGETLMPGLMDAHVHLTMDTMCGKNIIWHHLALHPSLRAYHALANAQKALNAGFTTLRTMQAGGPDMGGDAALHDAVEQCIVVGPRIVPSAMIFGMTGGHNDMFVPAVFKERWATADGVDECRKAARTAIRAGAEFLKIFTSGGVFSMKTSPDARNYTLEEIEAICDEANSQGRPRRRPRHRHARHQECHSGRCDNGRTRLETRPGSGPDDADHGTHLVPTLAIGHNSLRLNARRCPTTYGRGQRYRRPAPSFGSMAAEAASRSCWARRLGFRTVWQQCPGARAAGRRRPQTDRRPARGYVGGRGSAWHRRLHRVDRDWQSGRSPRGRRQPARRREDPARPGAHQTRLSGRQAGSRPRRRHRGYAPGSALTARRLASRSCGS